LEPQRERNRHVLGALTFDRVGFRQQQPRFQIGEPCRHHQIISRELESELARLLDESEILVGQRQDRDFGEVDFLLAREREQKIERALESLDVDYERRFLARPLGHKIALQLDVVGIHEIALRAAAPALTSAANSARSAARSSSTTCPRRPSAASARAAALPVSTGTAPPAPPPFAN